MTRVTVTLGEMTALLDRLRVGDALRVAAERGGALLADGVRARLSGTPGGAHDAPWLRSGGLRESVGVVVSAEGDVVRAVVGSSDPAAVAQELGTVHVPARPFLTPVAAALGEQAAALVRDVVAGEVMGGR